MSHTHKLVRITIGRNKRQHYKCALPACTFNIRPELAEGREVICNVCGDKMILDKTAMLRAKPHCKKCTKGRDKVATIEQLIEKLEL